MDMLTKRGSLLSVLLVSRASSRRKGFPDIITECYQHVATFEADNSHDAKLGTITICRLQVTSNIAIWFIGRLRAAILHVARKFCRRLENVSFSPLTSPDNAYEQRTHVLHTQIERAPRSYTPQARLSTMIQGLYKYVKMTPTHN